MYDGQKEKYIAAIFAFGHGAGTVGFGQTRYLAAFDGTSATAATGDVYKIVMPDSGVLKNLSLKALPSTLTGIGHSVEVLINGASAAPIPLIVTWKSPPSGPPYAPPTNITALVNAGDAISVRLITKGTSGTLARPTATFELEVDADYPNQWDFDSNTKIMSYSGGDVEIGTNTSNDALTVHGMIETNEGIKFPDGSIQLEAATPATGEIHSLDAAGGTPVDAVFVAAGGNVGIGIDPTDRKAQEKLTLGPGSNLAIEMSTPTGIVIKPIPGGNLTPGDYFFRVAASDGIGWTKASGESSITLSGVNQSCTITWDPVLGAKTKVYKALCYKIYRATTAGGPYESLAIASNWFQYDSDAGFTPDIPPTETTAYISKLSSSGPSWVLGGGVGIGMTSPQATLDVRGDIRLQFGPAISEFSTAFSGRGWAVPTESAVKDYIGQFLGSAQAFVKDHINNLFVGSVTAFAMEQPPEGWLECNGQALSRADYARLFDRIGTTFGEGDGAATFNVPDLRGEFVRGWSHDRPENPDPDRKLGTWQAGQLAKHSHKYAEYTGDTWQDTNVVNRFPQIMSKERDAYVNPNPQCTQDTGGNETRPRNIALMYCIYY